MLDIISELNEKKSEVISLHEVITSLMEQSPGATLPQIAEWLLIHLVNDPSAPRMERLTLGGVLEPIPVHMMDDYPSLQDLLVEIYRNGGMWPREIPF